MTKNNYYIRIKLYGAFDRGIMCKKLLLCIAVICIGSINAMESIPTSDKNENEVCSEINNYHKQLKNIYENDVSYQTMTSNEKAEAMVQIFEEVFKCLGISPDKSLSEDLDNRLFNSFNDIIGKQLCFSYSETVYEAMICLFVNERTSLILKNKKNDENEKVAQINPSHITDSLVKMISLANTEDSKNYEFYFTQDGTLYIRNKKNLNTYEPLFNKDNKDLKNTIKTINYKNLVNNLLKIVKAQITEYTNEDKFKDMIKNEDFSAIHNYVLQDTCPIKTLVETIIEYEDEQVIDLNTYKSKLIKLLYDFYKFQYKQAKFFVTTDDKKKFISHSEYYNNKDYKFASSSQCQILRRRYNKIDSYLSGQMQNFEKKMNNNFIDNFEEINNIDSNADAISEDDNNIGDFDKISKNNAFDDFEIIE